MPADHDGGIFLSATGVAVADMTLSTFHIKNHRPSCPVGAAYHFDSRAPLELLIQVTSVPNISKPAVVTLVFEALVNPAVTKAPGSWSMKSRGVVQLATSEVLVGVATQLPSLFTETARVSADLV